MASELRQRKAVTAPVSASKAADAEPKRALGKPSPLARIKAEPTQILGRTDYLAIAGLLLVCGFTRYWRLDKPPGEGRRERHGWTRSGAED
jgi:hypothetical protein